MGFIVDEVELGEVFLQGHQSSLSVSFKNMLKKEIKNHCYRVSLRIKTVLKLKILNLVSEF